MLDSMGWRVAVTHDDNADRAVQRALEEAGCVSVFCPVLVEGPPPDRARVASIARELESFDWIICASARAVRAITEARRSPWPEAPRTAAVGPATAAAMRDAGARDPVVGTIFTARGLWDALASLDDWRTRRVLATTVARGRRELIDALRAAGAEVTELEAYSMVARPADDIRRDWATASPNAVLLGSAETARHLVNAIGIEAMHELDAVVPIGPTTAAALSSMGLSAAPPPQATFLAAVEQLKSIRDNRARRSSP